MFNTLNQLPIFRPEWIYYFFPVLQFNQLMGPGEVLQPFVLFCFFFKENRAIDFFIFDYKVEVQRKVL